jgi:hypothetical protein
MATRCSVAHRRRLPQEEKEDTLKRERTNEREWVQKHGVSEKSNEWVERLL